MDRGEFRRRRQAPILRGEANPNSRLSDEKVLEIRERRAAGVPVVTLCLEYDMSGSAINNLLSGKSWGHVGGPLRPPADRQSSQPSALQKLPRELPDGLDQDSRQGSRNPNAHLTEEQVLKMRERFAAGVSVATLCREHEMSEVNINCILSGKTWRHVGGPLRDPTQPPRQEEFPRELPPSEPPPKSSVLESEPPPMPFSEAKRHYSEAKQYLETVQWPDDALIIALERSEDPELIELADCLTTISEAIQKGVFLVED